MWNLTYGFCAVMLLWSIGIATSLKVSFSEHKRTWMEKRDAGACEMAATTVNASEAATIVNAHNLHRAEESASGMFAMVWSDELAQRAQAWADHLARTDKFEHGYTTKCDGTGISQNLFRARGSNARSIPSVVAAVESWYSEKPDYTYSSNSCAPSKMCGHYTQVVWDSSRFVGCGATTTYIAGGGYKIVVACDYYPQGNWVGKKPFAMGRKGTTCALTDIKAPRGYGWTVRSDGLCDFCAAGSRNCNCYPCANGATLKSATCTCTCPSGYSGAACDVNCIDRKSSNTCRSWSSYCTDPMYSAFMQDNCPCSCSRNGLTKFTCCQ